MNKLAVGSTFEISLRILLMLNAFPSIKLDAQQISAVDFIAVYAADFSLMDENLHGYSNYRFGEYVARKEMVSAALKDLVLDSYIRLHSTSTGYQYSILEAGRKVCSELTSNYAKEYILAVQATVNRFDQANEDNMLKEINRQTVRSLQEVGHE